MIAAERGPLAGAREAFADLLDQPRHLLALRLTLVLLMLHGAQSWELEVLLRIVCGVAIVCLPLTTSPRVWLLIAAGTTWINALHWYSIDNHKYLITYWCLVCALAVSSRDPGRTMSRNARVLIGLCFLLATLWKVMAAEYVDGSFLHYTFLTDARVESTAGLIAGLGPAALASNQAAFGVLAAMPGAGVEAQLATTDALRVTTLAMSYWTLFIEGIIALAFLAPRPTWLSERRDLFLMAFVASTYFLLPVIGFAFVLSLLGFVQCPRDRTKTRVAYLVLLVAIQLTRVPWNGLVGSLFPGLGAS